MHDAVHADPPLLDGQAGPTDAQRAQHAIERLKRLFGKDFPVLPRFAIGPYATEFNASLAEQGALTVADPWRINGWLDAGRAGARRRGSLRRGCLGARGVVRATGAAATSRSCSSRIDRDRSGPRCPKPGARTTARRSIRSRCRRNCTTTWRQSRARRIATSTASRPIWRLPCMRPAWTRSRRTQTIAAFVCDEWPEFIPDPFQTAGIGFHYDAPGARPPQAILLALPPQLDQDAWSFDDAVDVIHEAFDLAKLRGVRPRDLAGGLGAMLPGNYLPHTYTDDLPSVRVLEMLREAQQASRDVRGAVDRQVHARQDLKREETPCASNSRNPRHR